MRFLYLAILVVFFASCGPSMNKILKSKDATYKLSKADSFYAQKKYVKASTLYEDVLPYYKTATNYQDLYYRYAYSVYNQKDYLNAENLFKTFLESFPSSARYEEIEYMRAYAYFKQAPKAELDPSNTYRAIGLMQTFINAHPTSLRIKDANTVIEDLRKRLEKKDLQAARLYYDMKHFRAASVAYNSVLENFPESDVADEYKYMSIKSSYKFADLSVTTKKQERFEEVLNGCADFINRFPESKYKKEIDDYIVQSNKEIQKLNINE